MENSYFQNKVKYGQIIRPEKIKEICKLIKETKDDRFIQGVSWFTPNEISYIKLYGYSFEKDNMFWTIRW